MMSSWILLVCGGVTCTHEPTHRLGGVSVCVCAWLFIIFACECVGGSVWVCASVWVGVVCVCGVCVRVCGRGSRWLGSFSLTRLPVDESGVWTCSCENRENAVSFFFFWVLSVFSVRVFGQGEVYFRFRQATLEQNNALQQCSSAGHVIIHCAEEGNESLAPWNYWERWRAWRLVHSFPPPRFVHKEASTLILSPSLSYESI